MANIIQGDLIKMALDGQFDIIGHGCNCFCIMGNGIAKAMSEVFKCDEYLLEDKKHAGSYHKMGNIQYQNFFVSGGKLSSEGKSLKVYNLYTQYAPGVSMPPYGIPLDYDALRLCIRKLFYLNNRSNIGLPWIGCGLGGGDKDRVLSIIKEEETHIKGSVFIVSF